MLEPQHYMLSCMYQPTGQDRQQLMVAQQAEIINRLLLDGLVVQYALSEETGHWWAIVMAETEWEARSIASHLPLCADEVLKIVELSHFACNENTGFSLN